MKTAFVVDDNDTNLMAARAALDSAYKVYALPSAARMFELSEKISPDFVILDVDMPDMDGFEALELMKGDPRLKGVPVMLLTSIHDPESEVRGFELGALDIIIKPFAAAALLKRVESRIDAGKRADADRKAARNIRNATIRVIADMVESRDEAAGGHIERTQMYLETLVSEMISKKIYAEEMAGWDLSLLLPAAQLHDVGKLAISDAIISKPGKLTDEEFALVKQHCAIGERMIDRIAAKAEDDGFLRHAKMFAGYHHEKWDGTGYHRRLKGPDIPLEGRIMAIADVYDALVSERPYKMPFTHDRAVEIIKTDCGTHFDPKIVEAFLSAAGDIRECGETYRKKCKNAKNQSE